VKMRPGAAVMAHPRRWMAVGCHQPQALHGTSCCAVTGASSAALRGGECFASSHFSTNPPEYDQKGVFGGEEEGGGVRSGPGAARTILLFHIISARPSKQSLMVRTFLKVYMELGSYFLFLQEQIKDIIIPAHANLSDWSVC
jgi:hypothetical protein